MWEIPKTWKKCASTGLCVCHEVMMFWLKQLIFSFDLGQNASADQQVFNSSNQNPKSYGSKLATPKIGDYWKSVRSIVWPTAPSRPHLKRAGHTSWHPGLLRVEHQGSRGETNGSPGNQLGMVGPYVSWRNMKKTHLCNWVPIFQVQVLQKKHGGGVFRLKIARVFHSTQGGSLPHPNPTPELNDVFQ